MSRSGQTAPATQPVTPVLTHPRYRVYVIQQDTAIWVCDDISIQEARGKARRLSCRQPAAVLVRLAEREGRKETPVYHFRDGKEQPLAWLKEISG